MSKNDQRTRQIYHLGCQRSRCCATKSSIRENGKKCAPKPAGALSSAPEAGALSWFPHAKVAAPLGSVLFRVRQSASEMKTRYIALAPNSRNDHHYAGILL